MSLYYSTKTFPVGKELTNNPLRSKLNEETKESIKVVSTNGVSNGPELENNDLITDKNIDDSSTIISKTTLDSTLTVVDFSEEKSMESAWNKDVNVNTSLFPNSQSMVMQRVDEQEKINMNLAENIITVQLEQFRLNEEKTSKSNESCNEPNNEW